MKEEPKWEKHYVTYYGEQGSQSSLNYTVLGAVAISFILGCTMSVDIGG
jgi:hypothetical protein